MRCSWAIEGEAFNLELRPDPEDDLIGRGQPVRVGQEPMEVQLATGSCRVILPFALTTEPHPDLLAVAAYSVAKPWTRRRLRFDRPVSARLASTFANALGITVSPVDKELQARERHRSLVLSYSGGMDSIAASTLIPGATPLVHLRRIGHRRVPNRATHVRSSEIADLATRAREYGREVEVVQTDLEFLCLPLPTFPEWTTVAIGAVLMADHYATGGIVFGSILEAIYLDNGRAWCRRDDRHLAVFEAASLPILEPVGGLSEVATHILAQRSELWGLARSCLLGTVDAPCLSCIKCLRKELISAALTGDPVPDRLVEAAASGFPGLDGYFGDPPYFMNDVMSWALSLVDVSGTSLAPIKQNVLSASPPPAWIGKLYSPALQELSIEPWRTRIERELLAQVDPMSEEEERQLRGWRSGKSV